MTGNVSTNKSVIAIAEWAAATMFCFMSCEILKRSFIALLVLVLASTWQAAPSFALQPCDLQDGSTLAASGACIGHCKAAVGDCMRATTCCAIPMPLAVPSVPRITTIDWDRVPYPDKLESFIGRHLEPDLHPPTTRI